jgi:CBS domain-containing protein
MKIRDVMTPNVECVWPDDTLQEAALAMKEHDVGLLPVCRRDRIAGMLTDRDIAVRAVALGRDPTATRVGEIMTNDVICCYEDDDTEKAAQLMRQRQVRRILVLNHSKLLVGIVSLGDLAAYTGDPQCVGEVLREVSEPPMQWSQRGSRVE